MADKRARQYVSRIPGRSMKTGKHLTATASIVVAAIATIVLGYSQRAYTCALEPSINGGITISYPGSIDVAVAVASARSDGLLPPASSKALSNDVRKQQILADLRRLQARLNTARNEIPVDDAATFSLVLVGPGLWSHYRMSPGGVLANYHTDGPIAGKVVVLTHAAALRSMLGGSLSIEQATKLGLIAYSGVDTSSIQRTFQMIL
ncbi:MAG: hypothetical protein HKP12_10535 [Gammaproteobacteria bacterium]|nr:hypothetical protein [Gammaproteobacteria bacterium]